MASPNVGRPQWGYFKLQFQSGYADADGGALYMTPQYFPTQYRDASGNVVTLAQPRLLFYVAYGNAGVVKLDWSNVAQPDHDGHQGGRGWRGRHRPSTTVACMRRPVAAV